MATVPVELYVYLTIENPAVGLALTVDDSWDVGHICATKRNSFASINATPSTYIRIRYCAVVFT